MHSTESTQQRVARAAVITGPVEDLFIVYNGITEDNSISMAGYVNPFVIYVWVGFGILVLGTVIATLGRRGPKVAKEKVEAEAEAKTTPADTTGDKE
jgi:cytochrome c-type biogenesis protein CcmF